MKLGRYIAVFACLIICFFAGAQEVVEPSDSIDNEMSVDVPVVDFEVVDSISVEDLDVEPVKVFNPDPTRATWLSALCPGLGQIYNRRYWKLPIVVGAYMGLVYATSWNNTMLTDYTRAYRDLTDNDPNTKSYMAFFAPNVSESSLNQSWLIKTFQSRKNYFRRNRDLCIIGMVGVYLLAIVDAYVDASLAHFDISPDLSLEWTPMLIQEIRNQGPSFGVQCSLNF